MSRLTKRLYEGKALCIEVCEKECVEGYYECHDCKPFLEVLKKLAEYEDAEEQGLLLKLPCKVGDTVYAYCSEFGILSYDVDTIIIDEKITYQCSAYSEPIGDCPSECLDEIEPDIADFGKTVFLTKEEAEQALKQIGE